MPAMLLALFLLACRVSAQEPLFIGLAGGYEFGIPLTIQRTPGIINRYNFDGSGTSRSTGQWFGGYFNAPGMLGGFDLSVRLNYRSVSEEYRSENFFGDPEYDPNSLSIIPMEYWLELSSSASLIEMDIAAGRRFPGGWRVEGGFWYSRRGASSITRTLHRLDRDIIHGLVIDTPVARETGEELGSQRSRFGLMAAGGVRVPLLTWLALQPEISLRLDIPALGEHVGWQSFTLGAGGTLLFDIRARGADTVTVVPDPAPPPVAEEAPSRAPRLAASIDLYSIDEHGRSSQTSATRPLMVHLRQQVPFPATVFFGTGAVELPDRYARLVPSEVERYSDDVLVHLEPERVYLHALNLLGMRLRRYPTATVTLIGSRDAGESTALPEARAESVRAYLHEIWGIDRHRVDIAVPVVGEGDAARCVRMESDSQVMAPVVTEWHARTYTPLAIDLRPEIEAEAGVRAWSVAVRQGERIITRYSSDAEDGASGSELALHIPENSADTVLPPLVAELIVEDSTGARVAARDTLPLLRDEGRAAKSHPPENEEIRSREIYLLRWDTTATGGGMNAERDLLKEIARDADEGTRIVISRQSGGECGRCTGVADILGAMTARAGAEIRVEDARAGAFTGADPPEERAVGEMVRIEVERTRRNADSGRP